MRQQTRGNAADDFYLPTFHMSHINEKGKIRISDNEERKKRPSEFVGFEYGNIKAFLCEG